MGVCLPTRYVELGIFLSLLTLFPSLFLHAADQYSWTCEKASETPVSAFTCRQLCSEEDRPCFEMDEKECYCCFN